METMENNWNRIKCLKRLGISDTNARKTAFCQKSYWFVSACPSVHHALNNERLKQKGLIMPDEYYKSHYKDYHVNNLI